MSNEKLTVLAIFAHPDDEIGCAGTMANHSENGDDVHLAFLTKGENITNMDGTEEEIIARRKAHTEKIEKLLGVTVHFLDFPDSLIEYNVLGGYKVARLIKEVKPNIIITWNQPENLFGSHPDHVNTSKLVMDAVSYARYQDAGSDLKPYRDFINVFQYSNIREPNVEVSRIIRVDVTKQMDKIKEFVSIYEEAYGRPNMFKFHSTLHSYLGLTSGTGFAEEFRWVMGYNPPLITLPAHIPPFMRGAPKKEEEQ